MNWVIKNHPFIGLAWVGSQLIAIGIGVDGVQGLLLFEGCATIVMAICLAVS